MFTGQSLMSGQANTGLLRQSSAPVLPTDSMAGPESPLEAAFGQALVLARETHDAVCSLQKRLCGVLTPSPPGASNAGSAPAPVNAPLVQALAALAAEQRVTLDILRSIHQELAL